MIGLCLPFAVYILGMLDDDVLSQEASLLHRSIWSDEPHDERDDAKQHEAMTDTGRCVKGYL